MNNKTELQIVGIIASILMMVSMLTIMRLSSEGFWTGLSLIIMFFSMMALSSVAQSDDDNS